jgi:hypothetical protein
LNTQKRIFPLAGRILSADDNNKQMINENYWYGKK